RLRREPPPSPRRDQDHRRGRSETQAPAVRVVGALHSGTNRELERRGALRRPRGGRGFTQPFGDLSDATDPVAGQDPGMAVNVTGAPPDTKTRTHRLMNPALVAEARERRQKIDNRIADRVTAFSGSMAFVWIHAIWFGCWIGFGIEAY